MKEKIGSNAGLVWNALNEQESTCIKDVKKATKLSEKELFAALGWLAREEKINFNEVEGDIFIAVI